MPEVFGPDPDRYVSEWDYWAQERNRDFNEFYATDDDFMVFQNRKEGKSYREAMVISGRTADIALIPYKNESSSTSYVFVLSWRNLIFQGDLRPEEVGDEFFPYLEFGLSEQGNEGKILLLDKIETFEDLQGYATLEMTPGTASEIIFSFFAEIVYDLERESQTWKLEPKCKLEIHIDEANSYC